MENNNIKNFLEMSAEEVKKFIRDNPYEAYEICKENSRDLYGVIHLFSKVLQDIEYAKKFL